MRETKYNLGNGAVLLINSNGNGRVEQKNGDTLSVPQIHNKIKNFLYGPFPGMCHSGGMALKAEQGMSKYNLSIASVEKAKKYRADAAQIRKYALAIRQICKNKTVATKVLKSFDIEVPESQPRKKGIGPVAKKTTKKKVERIKKEKIFLPTTQDCESEPTAIMPAEQTKEEIGVDEVSIGNEPAILEPECKEESVKAESPDEFQLSHSGAPFEATHQEIVSDPLSVTREPIPTTIEIKEGQKGISYLKLFAPYMKNAKEVKLFDPYIRFNYQIHNLMEFCKIISPDEGNVKLSLVTAAESKYQEAELIAKLEEVQKDLISHRIMFTFAFDYNLHDRWLETDAWKIILGRGLDLYKKINGKFSLGYVDQTKRGCKVTTITYVRKE